MKNENRLLLADALPEFAAELRQLLIEKSELELAAQVPGMMIFDRCRCGDDFCGTFYMQPKPKGRYGPGHRNVALTPEGRDAHFGRCRRQDCLRRSAESC